MLLGSDTSLSISDQELDLRRPTGISSGGTSAPMPDDAFKVVDDKLAGSMFNSRGALIAYPVDNGQGKWRATYTASVAEVFGDGDVGIGRWNGGATVDGTRSGDDLTDLSPSQPLPSGSFHYAVARPPVNLPACGMRQLALVATTSPTIVSTATELPPLATGLTADSRVGFQYAAQTQVGFDIGVRGQDGSVTRYRSLGGADAPWASGISLDALALSPVLLQRATDGTSLSNAPLDVQGLAGGDGGTKLAVKLRLSRIMTGATELAAVFAAPGGVDSSGCAAAVGDPGVAIDPPPATGFYNVLLGMDDANPGLGDSTFTARGELASTPFLQVGSGTPVYELAGNANASIGRIDGPFTLGGTSYNRSLPYAVASRGAVLPSTGRRHFVLVASTLVMAQLDAGTGAELPAGRVQNASLDVVFDQFPLGAPNAMNGTASLLVSGSAGGVPFSISVAGPDGPMPVNTRFVLADGSFTDDSSFWGVLAAPSGNDAVVRFKANIGNRPATGTLLFRAQ